MTRPPTTRSARPGRLGSSSTPTATTGRRWRRRLRGPPLDRSTAVAAAAPAATTPGTPHRTPDGPGAGRSCPEVHVYAPGSEPARPPWPAFRLLCGCGLHRRSTGLVRTGRLKGVRPRPPLGGEHLLDDDPTRSVVPAMDPSSDRNWPTDRAVVCDSPRESQRRSVFADDRSRG